MTSNTQQTRVNTGNNAALYAQDKAMRTEFDKAAFERTFTHHTAEVNGVRLHYVVGGKGDPVVLLHGFPATWYNWRYVMPTLAERYTLIAPDMRGLGDSSKPLTGYDASTVADDIYQLVSKLGFKRVFVVGHDIGAPVAYSYAAAHPEDVRRLAVLEFVLAGAGLEELIIAASSNLWFFTFQAVPDLPEVLVAGKERLYLSAFFRPFTYSAAAITEDAMDEYVRAYSAPGGMRAAFEYYRAIPQVAKQTKQNMKTKLQMPVLGLAGDRSLGNPALGDPARKSIELLAENVRYSAIENCGHWIVEERPAYLSQQLLAFFGEEK